MSAGKRFIATTELVALNMKKAALAAFFVVCISSAFGASLQRCRHMIAGTKYARRVSSK
jgi:hypothetical protein